MSTATFFDNLLPVYPLQSDPLIQAVVTGKKEFRQFIGNLNERVGPGKDFYNHQEIIRLLMRFLDELLLYHEAGTGKTISFARATEDMIDRRHNNGSITSIIYLAPSKTLIAETKNQLVLRYPNSRYYSEKIANESSLWMKAKRITDALKGYYTFITYTSFVNQNKDKTDDQLIAEFAGTCFVCDEIHSINPRAPRDRINYDFLKRLFRLNMTRKIMLLTATLISNDVTEIMKYVDLMSPRDIPENDRIKGPDDPRMAEKIYKWFNGKVSYVRALDTGIDIKYEGNRLETVYPSLEGYTVSGETGPGPVSPYQGFQSFQILYSPLMSIHQSIGYTRAYLIDGKDKIWLSARETSDFVFPDGSYGTDGIHKWFDNPGHADFISTRLTDYFTQDVETCSCKKGKNRDITWENFQSCECKKEILVRIGECSTKLASMINTLRIVDVDPKTGKKKPRRGVTFVYFEFVGVGVGPACVALEAMGYERFEYGIEEEENKIKITEDNVGIPPRPRYIPLTDYPGQEKEIVTMVRDVINHPLNYQGEYVQVILGSRVTMLGLSFYHNVNIEIYDPWWNPSAIYQAKSRGIRATSHEVMLREIRKIVPDGRVTVHIYQYAALPMTVEIASNYLDILVNDDTENEDYAEASGYTKESLALYLLFLATGKVDPSLTPEYDTSLDISSRYIKNPQARDLDPNYLIKIAKIKPMAKNKRTKKTAKTEIKKIKPSISTARSKPIDADDDDEDLVLNAPREEDELVYVKAPDALEETNYPPSIEVRMYQDAEQKDRPIRLASRYVKRIAVDCELNLERNIREADEPFTPESDYQESEYEPVHKWDGTVDDSTWNILYSSEDIETMRLTIPEKFEPDLPMQYQYAGILQRMAIFEFEQEWTQNKFGFYRNYKDYGGYFYPMSYTKSPVVPLMESFYLDNLFISTQTPLIRREDEKIHGIREITDLDQLQTAVMKLQFDTLITMIEQILDDVEHDINKPNRDIENRVKPADRYILAAFYRFIRCSHGDPKGYDGTQLMFRGKPVQLIRELESGTRPRRRGTKGEVTPAKGSSRRATPVGTSMTPTGSKSPENIIIRYMETETTNDPLCVHAIEMIRPTGTAYKFTKQIKNFTNPIRVYDAGRWVGDRWESGTWRPATTAESTIYHPVLNRLIEAGLPDVPVLGLDPPYSEEYILMKTVNGKKSANKCKDRARFVVINQLVELGYKPADMDEDMTEEEVKAWIKTEKQYALPDDVPRHTKEAKEFEKRAALIIKESNESKTKGTRADLCETIREILIEKGLFFEFVDWTRARELP
jgi:hypothetical protein